MPIPDHTIIANMENSDQDEIKRLRRIIERLEANKGTRVITTEIVPREDKPGFLVYVTAPTATNEVEFGMAIYSQVVSALSLKSPDVGLRKQPEFVHTEQVAPSSVLPAVELFAWIGKDEYGSGEVGLKQAIVPAGTIPMVAIDRRKMEGYWDQAEAQAAAYGQQISLVRFIPIEVTRRTVAPIGGRP